MNFKSPFLQEFFARGFFAQTTHEKELDQILADQKITAYIGFDCTAKSLHAGSLIQIMILRLLQKHGHKPLILLGGGTTKIGDPSGKDEARQVLAPEKIAENLAGIKKNLEKFISFEGANAAVLVNNDDWLKNLNYLDFLRDIGRHFSINRMLTFDSVKTRLERDQSLSFLEFNYMILQAYDFYELNKNHNCRLQIGGSDQWGNIVNGVELTRRFAVNEFESLEKKTINKIIADFPNEPSIHGILGLQNNLYKTIKSFKENIELFEKTKLAGNNILRNTGNANFENRIAEDFKYLSNLIKNSGKHVFGLTSPLLTTADGKKMGKTSDGAIWLDETMLSPFDYFQYFRNTHDADVVKFLKLFTDLSLEEIAELEKLKDQEINQAKEILAFEAVKICHGEKTANEVLQKAREIFVAKNTAAFEEKEIYLGEEKAKKLVEIIFEIGACESKSAAKKLIEGKAVKINGEVVLDVQHAIMQTGEFELSIGKKKFFKILIK